MRARIGAGLLADLDSEALDVYSAGIEPNMAHRLPISRPT